MHIAFDGGCFQQGLLGGIYQVACGFLNAAKLYRPDLALTLVCDPRQGLVRDEALQGLSWAPEIVYAAVARSYDAPEAWPAMVDPHIRFFVDGKIVLATLEDSVARYTGPPPTRSFAILSRAAPPVSDEFGTDRRPRGLLIKGLIISGGGSVTRVAGHDRQLSTGFVSAAGPARWTDGAGFVPLSFFPQGAAEITVDVAYAAQEMYAMAPGPGADAMMAARRAGRDMELALGLGQLANDLWEVGCRVYFANHFTPISLPGTVNVAWAYDLIPVMLPQYFHVDAQLNFSENLKAFATAERLYAISETTRTDLLEQTGIDGRRVVAAGIAAGKVFSPRNIDAVKAVLEPFGLRTRDYILVVGTVEPRKNHLRLMQAYSLLRQRVASPPDLVIIGKMGWDFGQVLAYRADSALDHCIKILSDLPDNDLACFYSGALFSAYLSVYEGFGLPVLEAMACGSPVLTSDRSSMPEVAGGNAVLVNPYDVEAMAAAMQDLASDERMRTRLREQGMIRARHYTWQRSAQMIIDDLEQLVDAG